MDNFLSFDIEITNELPEGEDQDLSLIIPSTAAICTDYIDCKYFDNDPHMTVETANKLVDEMLQYQRDDYKVLTWNGLSFDLQLLGLYSGRIDDCARIALNHVDMMFLVVCQKGFWLGLDKALQGAKIEGKLHSVTLNDGKEYNQMSGKSAPILWRNKEFSAVRTYLRVDIEQPLKLARYIEETGYIRWIANSGKLNLLKTDLFTVKEALKLPLVDTSWMKSPKPREHFYKWIPEHILKEEGIL